MPKVGWVKLRLHRPIMENSIIKTVTISRTPSGKFYISILVEYENQILPIIPETFLGLDFAMHGLYVASDEEDADYPNFLRKVEKRLAKAQRKLFEKAKRQPKSKINKVFVWLSFMRRSQTNVVILYIRKLAIL